jgi:hypothetical protein
MTNNVADLSNGKTKSFFDRHAWKVLLVVIRILGFFGVNDMVVGAADLQNGETVSIHSISGIIWNELRGGKPKGSQPG